MEVTVDLNGARRGVSTPGAESADTRIEPGDTLIVAPVVAGG